MGVVVVAILVVVVVVKRVVVIRTVCSDINVRHSPDIRQNMLLLLLSIAANENDLIHYQSVVLQKPSHSMVSFHSNDYLHC